jgi:hypothetical protein
MTILPDQELSCLALVAMNHTFNYWTLIDGTNMPISLWINLAISTTTYGFILSSLSMMAEPIGYLKMALSS